MCIHQLSAHKVDASTIIIHWGGYTGQATSATPDHNDNKEGLKPPQQNNPVHGYTLVAMCTAIA